MFTVLVLGIVIFVENLSLDSIGLRRIGGRDALWAVGFCALARVLARLFSPVLSGLPANYIRTLDAAPLFDWTSIVAAAVSEELLYRGYFIERVSALTGSIVTAAFFSWTLFSALHLPLWGLRGVVDAAIFGGLITFFYIWRRNLLACVLMHALYDAVVGRDILFGLGPPIIGKYLGFGIYFRVFR